MFKENDIVRLKNYCNKYTFYKVQEPLLNAGLYECVSLLDNISDPVALSEDEIQKVTFYELLDYIRENKMKLSIIVPEDKRLIIENLWSIYGPNQITEEDKLILVTDYTIYDFVYDLTAINYMDKLLINYDDIDFEPDYAKYCLKQKLKDISNIAENEVLKAFNDYIVYGEDITFKDVLNECFKKYKDYILQEHDPIDDLKITDIFEYNNKLYYLLNKNIYLDYLNNDYLEAFELEMGKLTSKIVKINKDDYRNDYFKNHYTKYDMQDIIEESLKEIIDKKENKKMEFSNKTESSAKEKIEKVVKNLVDKVVDLKVEPKPTLNLYTAKWDDQVKNIFVNPNKKVIVLKWADGETTKAICDPEDTFDIESGVFLALAKREFTYAEIAEYCDWEGITHDMEKGIFLSLAQEVYTMDEIKKYVAWAKRVYAKQTKKEVKPKTSKKVK